VGLNKKWQGLVSLVRNTCFAAYDTAISLGIAKEVARVLLPEGLIPTKMYVNGTIRSWIHYINIRTGPETQKEHRDVALAIKEIFVTQYPGVAKALNW
jgi:thymidylate synthase (FAD)